MFSPFTVDQAEHLGARTVERVGVDIYVVDVFGESIEAEAGGQPVGKIVGPELQAKAGSDEMKMEAGMADGGDAVAEIVKVCGGQGKWHGDFQTLAKIKTVEGFLAAELGEGGDEIAEDTAEIGTQGGDGGVVANIEGGELFGQGVAVGFCEGPLGEVVGEPLGKEVMGAESLVHVVEDRGVAALLKARKEFLEISSGLIADAGEIGDGEKFERSFGDVHGNSS